MAYDVHLEIFEGPLDLLLYLIKKDDLEIAEIPIAQITAEYLSYLELMKELNLDVAGEFLVMASTLMQIKARMLLPSAETEEEDGPDPLEELKARLLEYQKYKEVAQLLGHKEMEYAHVYYRPAPAFDKDDYTLEASLFDLMEGFRSVLKELPKDVKEIVYKEIPIEIKIREILDMFEGREHLSFRDILRVQPDRHSLVVCFLAILELVRLKQIVARQNELFDEIRVYRVKDDVAQETAAAAADAAGAEALKGTELYAAQDASPESAAPEAAVAEPAVMQEPAGGTQADETPVTDAPAAEEPAAETPLTEAAEAGMPGGEMPEAEGQTIVSPDTEMPEAPASETPAPGTPTADLPVPEAPAPETEVMDSPVLEAAAAELLATGSPAAEAPAADEQVMGSPDPEIPAPEASVPEVPSSEVQLPEAPAPERSIETNDTGSEPEEHQ